jgi:hypothetical protein
MMGGTTKGTKRQEADDRAQARQLQVHPVDRGDEEEQTHCDGLEREPEREFDGRPELRVVEDEVVRGDAAALPGLLVLDAEQERRDQRDQEVRAADEQPHHRRERDAWSSHLAHRDARRCNGT